MIDLIFNLINKYKQKSIIEKMDLANELDKVVRYFIILTPGHSGSLWLSKILSAHPDVLCFHEGPVQKIFPKRYYNLTDEDIMIWLYSLKSTSANHYGKIYKAIGGIGKITPSAALSEKIRPYFLVFNLTRNPINFINSQLQSTDERVIPKRKREVLKISENAVSHSPQIKEIYSKSLDNKLFVWACWEWSYYAESSSDALYRMEDLTSDLEILIRSLEEITGINISENKYFMDSIKNLMENRVNSHLKEKRRDLNDIYLNQWNNDQRFLFNKICGLKAKELYPELSNILNHE
ncbi:MAG: hypothetical protein US71_C0003G0035 [Parcubacteria group bacterium GW2011_GWD2_38_12]|nr:MAG: hypothetical protein US06_C0004G0063 [Parcubacteria group bacterium GW2011_GWC2_36_17]KKQ52471.1 MAG: hypothetical protein US71_C0003G0035 [Parcubacteria group bacterium GW2011_GWD2_38_12]KKQ58365.1 MAG: hypothetical protein US79_C0009G0039 [Parcubacteria group bacterium GW2011_GWC1_38_17]KKQ59498.1 MAG: hypothetical protein US78_C0003G0035 [Parcubacteria group bacterium GW2011_GWD1_38_16]